jgi:hypothetical protein
MGLTSSHFWTRFAAQKAGKRWQHLMETAPARGKLERHLEGAGWDKLPALLRCRSAISGTH